MGVRKYKEVKICVNKEEIEKLSKKERMDGWKIYHENLAAVLMKRNVVTLNKPRYVGTAVLGLSKEIMYDFHYKYIMDDYPNANLLFSDTDSFCYYIETDNDIYKDISGMISQTMLSYIQTLMIVNTWILQ